jgi:hypothetical protein
MNIVHLTPTIHKSKKSRITKRKLDKQYRKQIVYLVMFYQHEIFLPYITSTIKLITGSPTVKGGGVKTYCRKSAGEGYILCRLASAASGISIS